jgi:hypothetical protein
MGYKIDNIRTNYKQSFAFITTIILVVLFGLYLIKFAETNMMGSQLNRLKYLNLQGVIYLDYIKDFIYQNDKSEILNLKIDDDRFSIDIKFSEDRYFIVIQTVDQSNIRLSEVIIK